MPDRTRARELAAQFDAKGDPLGWFDALYREAESGATEIPWLTWSPIPTCSISGNCICTKRATNQPWRSAAVSATTPSSLPPGDFTLPPSTFPPPPSAPPKNAFHPPRSNTSSQIY